MFCYCTGYRQKGLPPHITAISTVLSVLVSTNSLNIYRCVCECYKKLIYITENVFFIFTEPLKK